MMLKFEGTTVSGFEAAVRGMRNPLNSWAKSDSFTDDVTGAFILGDNDADLMRRLNGNHREEAKFMRMITVSVDIVAPRYWWTEFDTYGHVVRNSCSTMHKILSRPLEMSTFSTDGLSPCAQRALFDLIYEINYLIKDYKTTQDDLLINVKALLPESYLQRATISTNYETLHNMYAQRKRHRLPEWREDFTKWVKSLPYSELITGVSE